MLNSRQLRRNTTMPFDVALNLLGHAGMAHAAREIIAATSTGISAA
jgi:hypothetical protein